MEGVWGANLEIDGFFKNYFTRSERKKYILKLIILLASFINVLLINWRHYQWLQFHEEVQSNLFNQIDLKNILYNNEHFDWKLKKKERD